MNKLFIVYSILCCIANTTFGQCDPFSLHTSFITSSTTTLNWTAPNANTFSVKWRVSGETIWTPNDSTIFQTLTNFPEDTLFIDSLLSNTTYQWRVRPYGCTPTQNWWNGPDFTTTSPCNKNISQNLSGFNPDPVYNYHVWSFDTLIITNLSNCDLNIRPKFTITHDSLPIQQGDFVLKYINPINSIPTPIPYQIDANGNAYGYFSWLGDTTGINLAQGTPTAISLQVKFVNTANYGTYSAIWETQEVESDGTFLQTFSPASQTSLSFVDCSIFDVNITSFADISCYGLNNGTATINNISNGSGSYTYAWNNGEITQTVSNLQAGNYSCTITDNNWSSCSASTNFTITEPDSITSNYTTTNVSCYGESDGGAIVNFFGGNTGSAPGDTNYILSWDTLIYVLPFPYTTFTTPIGVPSGIYPFSATDLNGCTHSDTITITQPDSLFTAYTLTDYSGYNISCNGDNNATIDVQINGGTFPFTHYFNGSIINNNPIQNVGSGIFTDSIIDDNGCTYSDNVSITEPTPINATLTSNDISCFNYCDGEIQTSVNGGVAPYSYNWNTTNNIDSLCAGSYTVVITDHNGCDTNLSISIAEPNAISYVIDSIVDISTYGSNNGLINISSFGGSGNLNFSWNGPNGFSSTAEDISNLIAGTYYITITDSNACMISDTIVLTQPSSLSVSLSNDSDISCNGLCDGSIDITANGGDSVYSYLWTGPNGFTSTNEDINGLCSGAYDLALSDSTNTINYSFNINEPLSLFSFLSADSILCYNDFTYAEILVYGGTSPFGYNWSNGATNYFTDLNGGGIHTVEVIDSNGCILLDTILLSNPDSISLQASIYDVSCYGMQDAVVEINVTNGGTTPYLYSANNGINNQPSSIFYNIGVGSYTYLVSDANGCSNEIHLTVNQPDSFYNSFLLTNTSCYGECDGIAIVTIAGGTPPYSQDWGGAISSALCAGYYNVTITDFNGCIITDGVTITEPNPIIVNIWQNGINIEATSGFNTYQWYDDAGNAIVGATTNIFVPTIQGEYYVQVTDSNGCSINSYSILFLINIIGENNLSVNIYPNPTNGKLIIECSEDYNTILVFNILGNTVCQIDNKFEKQAIKTIDLSSFEKGIYFIQIEANNQLINQRIILQ